MPKEQPLQPCPQNQDAAPMQSAMNLTDFQAKQTDPQGSYTGVPAHPGEQPVHDADDL